MTHVVTRACCNDAACTAVCPVNCIHPTPDEPGYTTAELLYIDPKTCINCGACVEVCPVDAIVPEEKLAASQWRFLELNARFFDDYTYARPGFVETLPVAGRAPTGEPLRLAVIGSGPAAMYTVEAALEATGGHADIHVFERLPVPWGLVRFGVAPDHQDTKRVVRGFERILAAPQVTVHLNVAVGQHISHDELLRHHHAAVYATGAPEGRALDIPGEHLDGYASATDFVAWYNGDPDAGGLRFDLSGPRAVVVGNGNVALDVARILVSDPEALGRTDIADHALAALRDSAIEEVVVLGRRGPEEAAYSTTELLSLADLSGVDIVVDPADLVGTARSSKAAVAYEFAATHASGTRRRIVVRYLASPLELLGTDRVSGLRIGRNELVTDVDGREVPHATGAIEDLSCGLVLSAVGYRGRGVPGVPFDERRGTFPHVSGRVVDDAGPVPGVYTAGWVKRGPSGVIGTNRSCASETVTALIEDLTAGRLPTPPAGAAELAALLAVSQPESISLTGWQRVDAHERANGHAAGRPRVKIVDTNRMIALGLSGT
jgi:ferredoxin/flavodoxin---NADP+ reductase